MRHIDLQIMLVQIPHCHQRQGVHSRFLQALPVCPIHACAGSPYGMVVVVVVVVVVLLVMVVVVRMTTMMTVTMVTMNTIMLILQRHLALVQGLDQLLWT